MTARRRAVAMGMVAAACIIAPAGAAAATTIGSDLSPDPGQACGAPEGEPCQFTSNTLPSGAPDPGSPIAGLVTSLRARTAGDAMSLTLRVTRQNPMSAFTFLNVGPEVTMPVTADASAHGHVTELTGLHLPIAAGDRLGVGYLRQPAANFFAVLGNHGSASCLFRQGVGADHPVGTERVYSVGCMELLLQGTVEADADGDGFGDDSQDLCPANPALQTACPSTTPAPTPKPKQKCKKAKKKSAAAAKKKCKKKKKP